MFRHTFRDKLLICVSIWVSKIFRLATIPKIEWKRLRHHLKPYTSLFMNFFFSLFKSFDHLLPDIPCLWLLRDLDGSKLIFYLFHLLFILIYQILLESTLTNRLFSILIPFIKAERFSYGNFKSICSELIGILFFFFLIHLIFYKI